MWSELPMTLISSVWAAACALLIGSVVVLSIRVRHRSHPHCRRCHHDLGPHTASLPSVCPECGSRLDRFMGIRRGPRLRRGLVTGVAIALLFIGGGTIASIATSTSREDVIELLPNWAIRVLRPITSKELADDLVQELALRSHDGEIGDADLTLLGRHALDEVLPPRTDAGPSAGFHDPLAAGGWVGPLARAARAGVLTEQDFTRLAAARTGHAIVGVATPRPDTLAVHLIVIDRWARDLTLPHMRVPNDVARAPWDRDASITLHVEGIEIGAGVTIETDWTLATDERDVQSEQSLHLLTDPRLARITGAPHAVGRLELRSGDGAETITHRFRTPIGGATASAPVSFDLAALEADVATAFDGARVAPFRVRSADEPVRFWYLHDDRRASGAPMIVHAARIRDGAGTWRAMPIRPWQFSGGSTLEPPGASIAGTTQLCAFDVLAQIDPESVAWVPITIEASIGFFDPDAVASAVTEEAREHDVDAEAPPRD